MMHQLLKTPAKPSKEHAIAASKLRKTYRIGDQSVHALDGVSLEIEHGAYVAIMGSSGSGKSTLMNMIGTLDVPTSGTLRLDGIDLGKMSANELANVRNRRIGFVFQQFNLLPGVSALRQVMLPMLYAQPSPEDPEGRARACLERVGLADRMDNRPSQLSGGQQQRVAIARAIANEPTLLLADEPTGALDSRTTEDILELFSALHRSGLTIILITHEVEVADRAERKIVLQDGRIRDDIRLAQQAESAVA